MSILISKMLFFFHYLCFTNFGFRAPKGKTIKESVMIWIALIIYITKDFSIRLYVGIVRFKGLGFWRGFFFILKKFLGYANNPQCSILITPIAGKTFVHLYIKSKK
jgi:hypothetical protein